jgi:predicted metal-binding membrane protein
MWGRALLTVALRGPGKGLLLASVVGWIAMAWLLALPHGGHAVAATATPMSHSPVHFTAMWSAMILAMAPPLLLREVGRLWRASLRRLRHLTIASFLCGYAGIWLLAGVALSTLFGWVTVTSERITVAVALVVLWHCSPARQRCLNACHRVPTLRVFGTAAQWDSLRFGVSTGCYCVAACGLLMLLVLVVRNYHLAAMAVATAVTTLERYLPARRPVWRLPVVRGRSLEWPDMPVAMGPPVSLRSRGCGA